MFKVGIVGCGRISPFHGIPTASRENVELIACCDIVRERAEAKAREFGCDGVYTDYGEMIAAEDLDVVHICLPHYLHAPVAIAAMEAGCHVLTEKPMATNMVDARAMVACAERNGVRLGVIFQNRYNAASVLVKNALEHGGIGSVQAAKATLTWYRSRDYYSESDWKGTWDKEGGGVIIDQAIHTLDLVRWFMDADIGSVTAHIDNRFHDYIEVEDVADGLICFDNGVRAAFWAMNYYSHDADVQVEITCENGLIKMQAEEATVEYFDGRTFAAKPDPNDSFDYGGGPSYWGASHVKQIDQFYDALEAGEEPEINGAEALKTQEMVCAIYQSAKTGRGVNLR